MSSCARQVFRYVRIFALLMIFVFPTGTILAATGVPTVLSYQGRLANSSGDLLGGSGTAYYFKFSIWDNATVGSGSRVWPVSAPTSISSTVRQGVFNVNIGDTAGGYPDALNYNFNANDTVYLQVEVSSDNSTFQTLSPRQRIASAAFAELAAAVSGTENPSSFGTTTPITNSIVTVEATTTTAVPISLRGKTSQTANLFQIQNASTANLLYVNSSGGLFASSTLQVTGQANFYGNVVVDGTTKFNNVTYTWPSSLTAGYFLQTDGSGALTWANAAGGAGGWTDGGAVVSPTTASDLISFSNASSSLFSTLDTIYVGRTATTTISQTALNVPTGATYQINGTNVLTGTVLGTGVITSSLTTVGALDSGSITTNFGAINIGADALTAGAGTFSSITDTGTLAVTGLATLGQASSTLLSNTGTAYFGGTATSTFDSAGNLTLVGNLVLAGDTINELAGTGLVVASNALTTTLGTTVAATELASADFGEFTCNGTTCSLDADTVAESELDLVAVTLADFTNDANFITTSGANTFTGLQTFTNASSSLFSTLDTIYVGRT
ncbi:MAG: hypothetical protein AAB468_02600, partial [Patescibacteria group bacterium]